MRKDNLHRLRARVFVFRDTEGQVLRLPPDTSEINRRCMSMVRGGRCLVETNCERSLEQGSYAGLDLFPVLPAKCHPDPEQQVVVDSLVELVVYLRFRCLSITMVTMVQTSVQLHAEEQRGVHACDGAAHAKQVRLGRDNSLLPVLRGAVEVLVRVVSYVAVLTQAKGVVEVPDAAEQQFVEEAETEASVKLNHCSHQHGAEVFLGDVLNCNLFNVAQANSTGQQLVSHGSSVERGRRALEQSLLQFVEVVDGSEDSSIVGVGA